MEFDDYRITKYCPPYGDIIQKKKDFEKEFRKIHPYAENIHRIVSNNSSSIKNEFMRIYNCKCAYCGISIRLLKKSSFEIDHIVAQSLFPSETKAGHLDNLTLSCSICNRNKSNFVVDKNILNPDTNIQNLYYRDDLLNICVRPNYINNADVVDFYEKLNLGDTLRRLDFVLMSLYGIQEAYVEKYGGHNELLSSVIDILNLKRNMNV